MASMNFKNNSYSTISMIAQGGLTLTVTDATKFPTAVPFIVTVWDNVTYDDVNLDPNMEVMLVTAVTGANYTVTRGLEGTTDVAHTGGVIAEMLITAGHMNDATYGIVTKLDAAVDVTAAQIATRINASTEVFNDANIAATIARDSELHNELHTVASHSDTTATGVELETLTDGSNADSLHAHAVNDAAVALNTTHRTSDGSDHSFIDQDVTNGSSPALVGTNVTAIPSGNLDFQKIGSPTYYTAQHWFDVVQSSGIIDGFVISQGDDVTHIDVTAGKGIIKSTDSELGTTISFEVGAVNELLLTALSINYIYVDYNAGSPLVAATTNASTIELNRMFPIGIVYSNTSSTHILNAGVHVSNLARTEHDRLIEVKGFEHASGAVTTNSTLDLITTAGVWYYGHNRVITDAMDTTGAGTFAYIHWNGSSWTTDNATASAIDATHYNDGDATLGTLTFNSYGVQWLYVTADSDYYVKYSTRNGTLAAAEAAVPPAQAHPYLDAMGELIAKIIVRQTGVIISIQQTHDVRYTTGSVANHNELGGIQGGTADEYYHATAAEYVVLGNTSGSNTGDAPADDTAYNATSWDANADSATKNAIRDKVEAMDTAIGLNTAKVTNVSTNLSEGTSTEIAVDVNSSDGTNATLVAASTLRAGLLTKAKFDEIVANTSKVTNVSTNLSEGTSALTTVDVNSSDGTNATLVAASTTRAGLLTKAKFDEIVANTLKNTNVSTALSLGTVNGTTVSITSDGGADDVTIPAATTTAAGLLTAALFDEIDANTAKVTNVSTNLAEGTSTETTVLITSSDGTDATLVAASTSRAGLLTKAKFDEIVANTAKDTNVSTALSLGTVGATTVAITSDGGADDVTLPAATTSDAGLLTAAKFNEIVANNAKVTSAITDGVSYGHMSEVTTGLNATSIKGGLHVSGTFYESAGEAKLYTASKDTYVDITTGLAHVYNEVANGAGAPAISGTNTRVFKVVTNGTDVTSIVDLRTMVQSGPIMKYHIQTVAITALATLEHTIEYLGHSVLGTSVHPLWQNDAAGRQMHHAYNELQNTTEYLVVAAENLSTTNNIPAIITAMIFKDE